MVAVPIHRWTITLSAYDYDLEYRYTVQIGNNEHFRPHIQTEDELRTMNDCVMRESRVVVLRSLESQILNKLHTDHPGIVSSKVIVKTYAWWPYIDKQLEKEVRS